MERRAYLWSDLDLRFVLYYKSNYIAEKIDVNDYKSMAQNRAAPPKVAIMVIRRLTYIYV